MNVLEDERRINIALESDKLNLIIVDNYNISFLNKLIFVTVHSNWYKHMITWFSFFASLPNVWSINFNTRILCVYICLKGRLVNLLNNFIWGKAHILQKHAMLTAFRFRFIKRWFSKINTRYLHFLIIMIV
jgi:hypothetical protein